MPCSIARRDNREVQGDIGGLWTARQACLLHRGRGMMSGSRWKWRVAKKDINWESMMNRWNIPAWLEQEVRARDTACVYCGFNFLIATSRRGTKPSWEHIINDASIITPENIARCCIACNASKGTKNLIAWLTSHYCTIRGITKDTGAQVVQNALAKARLHSDP